MVLKKIAVFCELSVSFEFSKSIFYIKNCLYYLKTITNFFKDKQLYKRNVLLILDLDVLYFQELCPIFVGYVNSQNIAISLKPIHFY